MKSLFDVLFPSDPALWACPLQNGIGYYMGFVFNALFVVAAIVFFYGVMSASIAYLTAFGNEERVKKGRETLKWSFIGAIVIMLSTLIISAVTNLFLSDKNGQGLVSAPVNTECQNRPAQ